MREARRAVSFDRSPKQFGGNMNKYVGRTLLILCIVAGIGGITATAQIDSDMTVEVNIPHAFVVRDTTLPAGKYAIKVLDESNLNVLEIRSANRRTAVLFETQDVHAERTPRQTEVVFDRVGDQYFLSQVWVSGSDNGAQVEKTKMEQRLEADGKTAEHYSVVAHHKSSKKIKHAAMTN
jgi:hypothetical protein